MSSRTPESPASSLAQVRGAQAASGVTMPTPVTTTRRGGTAGGASAKPCAARLSARRVAAALRGRMAQDGSAVCAQAGRTCVATRAVASQPEASSALRAALAPAPRREGRAARAQLALGSRRLRRERVLR